MFAEIEKKYLREDMPLPFAMVVATVGWSREQGAIHRPDGFPHHHWIYVVKGTMNFSIGGRNETLSAGAGMFMRPNVPHAYTRITDSLETRWVTFCGGDALLDHFGLHAFDRFTVNDAMAASFDELDAFCNGSSTIASRAAAGYRWLTEWLEQITAAQVDLCTKIRQYLETHYAEPLTLDDVAHALRMTRYTLCHYVADHQPDTIMQQLRRIRIAKAKQFLRYTTFSAAEIGRMCGFDSPSYFGKQFREVTGHSPGAWRDAHT